MSPDNLESHHAAAETSAPEGRGMIAPEKSAGEADIAPRAPHLTGIGGWLILPAIGFILGLPIGVLGLFVSLNAFPDVEAAGFGGLFTLEILAQIGLLAFMFYAATRFFAKRKNAPATIVALLLTSIGVSIVLLLIEMGADADEFVIETGKQLVRNVVGAAIWLPYFKRSTRVRFSFVK